MLVPTEPALILAPMEGVTDAPMRAVQGEVGVFAFAVTEFLRISRLVPPRSVFLRHVPELRTNSLTATGLPVQVQLLGGDPGRMAEAAVRAHEAGATAIDLNFGCPAPTVNRHDGGATLLKHPHRLRAIVAAVRAALPNSVPVSAKMRLGWDTIDAIDENAAMAAEGGASWIVIHGRTRHVGYAPPVFWKPIGRVREQLGIPVVANGDIWTIEAFRQCREETGCRHFMLGRSALADPTLARRIAHELGIAPREATIDVTHWPTLLQRLVVRTGESPLYRPERSVRRLKQWLKMAALRGPCPEFDAVKRTETLEEFFRALRTITEAVPERRTA